MDKRQKQIVQGRITDGTLFPNMALAIRKNTNSTANETKKRLQLILRQSMAAIQNDFDLTSAPPSNADGIIHGAGRGEDHNARMEERQALADQAQAFKDRYISLVEGVAAMG